MNQNNFDSEINWISHNLRKQNENEHWSDSTSKIFDLNTTYNELVQKFGKPLSDIELKGDSNYQWYIYCDVFDIVISIYDWNYGRKIKPNEKINWSVAFKNTKYSKDIETLLKREF